MSLEENMIRGKSKKDKQKKIIDEIAKSVKELKETIQKLKDQINNVERSMTKIDDRINTIKSDFSNFSKELIELKSKIEKISDEEKEVKQYLASKVEKEIATLKDSVIKSLTSNLKDVITKNREFHNAVIEKIFDLPSFNNPDIIFFDETKNKIVGSTDLRLGHRYSIFIRKKYFDGKSQEKKISGEVKGNIAELISPTKFHFEAIGNRPSNLLFASIEIREPDSKLKKLLIPFQKTGFLEVYVDSKLDNLVSLNTRSIWPIFIYAFISIIGIAYSIYSGIVNVLGASIQFISGVVLFTLIIILLYELKS